MPGIQTDRGYPDRGSPASQHGAALGLRNFCDGRGQGGRALPVPLGARGTQAVGDGQGPRAFQPHTPVVTPPRDKDPQATATLLRCLHGPVLQRGLRCSPRVVHQALVAVESLRTHSIAASWSQTLGPNSTPAHCYPNSRTASSATIFPYLRHSRWERSSGAPIATGP